MPQELDAVEVEHLALQYVGYLPQSAYSGQHGLSVHGLGHLLHAGALMVVCVFQNVDTSESLFAEILADNGNKVVEMLLILQLCHLRGKVLKTEFFVS